ncbi:NUDIX domain-containing protein [Roseomonas sp. NAR14]|uniref:NUDIX domain-containing protein n=1 Tax=Roseomonas acroporae TaxID=2937791 RepID=A0A9X2BX59_9PROT|nr:NUDIX domain-containing protein [Roseomonas acroporae]MCK8784650.1 NUDIX domain-containing protein [Roseomonas acroporae]
MSDTLLAPTDPALPDATAAPRVEGPPRTTKRAVQPKNAATVILWRGRPEAPEILMGLRSARHRFMPHRLVFPGGRVDRADHTAKAASELRPVVQEMLARKATPGLARALAVAAVRELFEETGLRLGPAGPKGGVLPDLAKLDYLCRAVTPPSRSIRFNARFLIAPAEAAEGEIAGSGELETLRFFGIEEALASQAAPITAMVLNEFREWLALPPARRDHRQLIAYRGMDQRLPEAGEG